VTPGDAGIQLAERAVALAEKLPETERLQVDVILAEKKGEDEKVRLLKRTLADLAPDDWLAQFQLGVQSFYDHKSQATLLYLNKAVKLNPKASEAYNYLGYVLCQQGQFDEGIAQVQKFVELKPQEPNSYDSLGEVLLMAGRFDQAEASFRKSAEMAPDIFMSWIGVSYARFFRGDWAGGREWAEKAKKFVTRGPDRLAVDLVLAWSHLAEGNGEVALHSLDAIEKAARAKKEDFVWAWTAFERAEMLNELGRTNEALRLTDEAAARAAKGKLSGEEQNRLRRSSLVLQAWLWSREVDLKKAEAALAQLEKELAAAPSNADLRGDVHFAAGEVALAENDAARAAASFAMCPQTDFRCRYELARAQDKAGEHAAAEETRQTIARANIRDNLHRGEDPIYLVLWARLKRKT
jgi:tetratricopeptide (TPR) repeat protein